MNDLPNPLTPADCDLRDTPVPRDMLVELCISTFGVTAAEALDLIAQIEPFMRVPISGAGQS
ncbi:hypothetical protein [Burkholderia pseudomallei]|uniref:hypothetical protein n=1 Tax=Burkholderia pseudomallei TaxID=28450 RepID=UPI0018A6C156|nr:hypothetical protein [Burkholderia pseudomallei]